ncbi:DNA phosphorothioation system sulfurtransferase DndC [Chloroflexota bacterium]
MNSDIVRVGKEILDQYKNDPSPRPWIIAFSGGKDSTVLLQLVWNAVKKLKPKSRNREIHIVCNNTLVENPTILSYVKTQLRLIEEEAIKQSMPITVTHTIPSLNDTFWVNLIGRGYVAPNIKFRWCTERLKIKPTTKYIQDEVSLYGEAIILLGSRRAESSSRAGSIKRHENKGRRLSKHNLPGAYVYSPIKDLPTQDIWLYLSLNESPWNSNNHDLVHLYKNASDNKDCPLITDKSTPPCGMSRFGCWVCTVTSSDNTMEGLISTGESWMKPLLEFRNMLAKTIDRKNPDYDPHIYRMPVRRNYQEGIGPYWPKWRKNILQRLLETEAEIRKTQPKIRLISSQELVTIQVIWERDFIYEYNVADICNQVNGRSEEFRDISINVRRENQLLRESCNDNEADYELINTLLRTQKNRPILASKKGLQSDMEHLLEEYLYPTFTDVYRESNNK